MDCQNFSTWTLKGRQKDSALTLSEKGRQAPCGMSYPPAAVQPGCCPLPFPNPQRTRDWKVVPLADRRTASHIYPTKTVPSTEEAVVQFPQSSLTHLIVSPKMLIWQKKKSLSTFNNMNTKVLKVWQATLSKPVFKPWMHIWSACAHMAEGENLYVLCSFLVNHIFW